MPRPTPATLCALQTVTVQGNVKRILAEPLTPEDFEGHKVFRVLHLWLEGVGATNLPDLPDEEDGVVAQNADDGAHQDGADGGDALAGSKVEELKEAFMELAAVAVYTENANFDGWSRSHGVDTGVGRQIASIIRRAGIPDDAVTVVGSVWTKQRFTEQSTTTLVLAAYESLGVHAEKFLGERPAALASSGAIYTTEHGLSSLLIAKTYVYLEMVGYKFGEWYQGKRAMNEMAGPSLIKFRTTLAAYLAAMSKKELLELAKSAEDIAEYAATGSERGLQDGVGEVAVKAAVIALLRDNGVRVASADAVSNNDLVRIARLHDLSEDVLKRIKDAFE